MLASSWSQSMICTATRCSAVSASFAINSLRIRIVPIDFFKRCLMLSKQKVAPRKRKNAATDGNAPKKKRRKPNRKPDG